MAGEYDINLSNGSVLATLHPLETNGPDGTSTPRKLQEARPTYAIGGADTGLNTFTINGVDLTSIFRIGFIFEVVNSTGNDGSYTVTNSVFSLGNTVITVASVTDATADGSIIAHIFRLNSDLTYRFNGSPALTEVTITDSASQAGSPLFTIDGVYNIQSIGAVYESSSDTTIIPVTNGSIRDNISPPAIYVPYGNLSYAIHDQNATIKLPGKGTMNYGEMIIEDLVRMVENFASDNPPNLNTVLGTNPAADPVVGQLWYNTTSGSEGFNVWDGSSWSPISASLISQFLVFSDVENEAGSPAAVPKIYIAGSESTLPAPWVGGSPNNLPGMVVWTDVNPATGEPIFRVLSRDGLEHLRVEYNGFVSTVNAIDVQSTNDSFFRGSINIGDATTGVDALVSLNSPSANVAGVEIYNNDVLQADIRVNGSGSPATLPLKINDQVSNDVVIANGGGNVGIGVLVPSHRLSVDGDVLVPAVVGGSPAVVFEVDQTNHWVGVNTSSVDATDIINDAMEVTGNLRVNSQMFGSDQIETNPTYSFTSDPDTGMFLSGINELSFTTNGVSRFTVEADGTLSVPAGYETLVLADGDIPNKRYVDDNAGGGSESWREPVEARDSTPYASNAGFPVTGIIDGVTLNDQDRVLFTNVNAKTDNDVWIYSAGSPSFWTKEAGRTVGDVVSVNGGTFARLAYIYGGNEIWNAFGSGAGINVRHESFISTGQTVFNLVEAYSVGTNRLFVYVDGVKQIIDSVGSPSISDYTETDSLTVTFDTAVPNGAVVEFFSYDELTANAVAKRETQTGLSGAPIITFTTITYAVGGDNLLVFLNGQKMVKDTDYTETTSNSITWVSPALLVSDVLEFYSTVPIVTGTRVRDIDDVSPNAPANGEVLVYNSSTGLYESQQPPSGKPDYVEYLSQSGAGSPATLTFDTPGVGGTNDHNGQANLQVFVNGVYQIEGLNYTAGTGNITLLNTGSPPPVPSVFDLVIYEFG